MESGMESSPIYFKSLQSEAHKEILAVGCQVNEKFKTYQDNTLRQLMQNKEKELWEKFENEKLLIVEQCRKNANVEMDIMKRKLGEEHVFAVNQAVREALAKQREKFNIDSEKAKCNFQIELKNHIENEKQNHEDDICRKISEMKSKCDQNIEKVKEEMRELNKQTMQELKQDMEKEMKGSLAEMRKDMAKENQRKNEYTKKEMRENHQQEIYKIQCDFNIKLRHLTDTLIEKDKQIESLTAIITNLKTVNGKWKDKVKMLMHSLKDLLATCKAFDLHHSEFVIDGLFNDVEEVL